MKKLLIPKILVVGAGRFGAHHIRLLKELHVEGLITLTGIVVRNSKNHRKIAETYNVPVYKKITPDLLKSVDAVDIVTPPETHFSIVKQCLPYTNVFVEKPLATKASQTITLDRLAHKYKRLISIGHIYRFDPITEKLRELMSKKGMPYKIHGVFVNPTSADQGREPSFELLHLFDIVDYIWHNQATLVYSRTERRIATIDVRYGKRCHAQYVLGWRDEEKNRTLSFKFNDCFIKADYVARTIEITKNGKVTTIDCPLTSEPLKMELLDFIKSIQGAHKKNTSPRRLVDAKTAGRIISIAEKAVPNVSKKPRVAIIGGGIFGTSIAAELGAFCSVTLFEKNAELLKEGTFINQFRHHFGYHYPRSAETVQEIQQSTLDFEHIFEPAIDRTIPTYYGLAKKGSLVTKDEFLTFCAAHNLPYTIESPPDYLLSKKLIDLTIKVPEPSYHHSKLAKLTLDRLAKIPTVRILYNTQVTNCVLKKNGIKTITYQAKKSAKKKQDFDYVINATYANINQFNSWLNFEKYPLRVDLAEVLIVNIPIEPISITVVDGQFATLMPTGNPHEFTLYHVKESILDRYVPEDGLIKIPKNVETRRNAIFRESLPLFPILKEAKIVESRIVHRGVRAYREYDDTRAADIIENGFGCWSILSGKILSSVTTAKKIAKILRANKK